VEGIARVGRFQVMKENTMKTITRFIGWGLVGIVSGFFLACWFSAVKVIIGAMVLFIFGMYMLRDKPSKTIKFGKTRGLDPKKYEGIKDRFDI
jgi:putative Mn2+ efflux pump MntP